MAQWGSIDRANNSPTWGGLLVNKTANTDNQTNMFNNATSGAFVSGQKVGVFGVSATEVKYPNSGSSEGVTAVTITNAGAAYTTLAVGLSGGGGNTTNFAATATGKVVGVTINTAGVGYSIDDTVAFSNGVATNAASFTVSHVEISNVAVAAAGGGYSNGDVVTMTTGTGTQATFTVTTGAADNNVASLVITTGGNYTANPSLANVATTNTTGSGVGLTVNIGLGIKTLSITNAGEYSTLPTLSNVSLTGGSGTGAAVDLSYGYKNVSISASGYGFTSDPTVTFGSGGSGAAATVTRGPRSNEAGKVTHAGWVIRREGTGGRAGRIQYETLVAMSSISGDASATDDRFLPQASV